MKPTDILAVIAHPDDELLCAGIVAHHVRHGRSAAIAVVTDGAGGRACYDLQMPPTRLAQVRHDEMLNSARALGVAHVEFLGFTDGGAVSKLGDSSESVTEKISKTINMLSPGIVLTHGPDGEYGHPHHKAVCRCTTQAVQAMSARQRPALYYCAAFWPEAPLSRCNRSVLADYVFPVFGRNYDARRQVMLSHVSQMDCLIGYFGRDADRECYHRVGPPNEGSKWFEVALD